jgi:regulator of replication initiation timing
MPDPTYEQLAERLSEALDDIARLSDENERLRTDNDELRRQLRTMRAA